MMTLSESPIALFLKPSSSSSSSSSPPPLFSPKSDMMKESRELGMMMKMMRKRMVALATSLLCLT
jgi:hypothetical protein